MNSVQFPTHWCQNVHNENDDNIATPPPSNIHKHTNNKSFRKVVLTRFRKLTLSCKLSTVFSLSWSSMPLEYDEEVLSPPASRASMLSKSADLEPLWSLCDYNFMRIQQYQKLHHISQSFHLFYCTSMPDRHQNHIANKDPIGLDLLLQIRDGRPDK